MNAYRRAALTTVAATALLSIGTGILAVPAQARFYGPGGAGSSMWTVPASVDRGMTFISKT
jgi:hypothetical protein